MFESILDGIFVNEHFNNDSSLQNNVTQEITNSLNELEENPENSFLYAMNFFANFAKLLD